MPDRPAPTITTSKCSLMRGLGRVCGVHVKLTERNMTAAQDAATRAPMIIAIDGPTASGKGTVAAGVAKHYGLKRLDTGALYRAVGLAVLDAGGDPGQVDSAVRAAERLDLGAI